MRSALLRLWARCWRWLVSRLRRRPPIPGRATVTLVRPTIRLPLDGVGLPGAVAVVRPFDLYDHAKWADAFPGLGPEPNVAAIAMVRAHLVTIAPLEMIRVDDAGRETAEVFDVANAVHVASLPPAVVRRLYEALVTGEGAADA